MRGVDVVVGRQRRRKVAEAATKLSRMRNASIRAPFKRPLSLTGWPQHFYLFIKVFKQPHFDIRFVTLLMSKIHQILYKDRWKRKEQLSFLAQLQIPKGLQVINSGTKSKLKFLEF
jgi:hypothetical protein